MIENSQQDFCSRERRQKRRRRLGIQSISAPCDLIIDGIKDEESRRMARSLLNYTLNTRGGVPSQAAGWLASMSKEELSARSIAADRVCALERGEVPSR